MRKNQEYARILKEKEGYDYHILKIVDLAEKS